MAHFIGVVFTVGILLLHNFSFAQPAGTGKIIQLGPKGQELDSLLKELITRHPRKEISQGLKSLIERGKVYFSFHSDQMPPEMGTELVEIRRKDEVVLVVNPNFLLKSTSFDTLRDRRYKELVIFHEFDHIRKHFSGEIELLPIRLEAKMEYARHFWNAEKSAVKAEWGLARELNIEYLMPELQAAFSQHGEQKGFLEGFYSLLTKYGTHHKKLEIFLPLWKKIYEEEKKKG